LYSKLFHVIIPNFPLFFAVVPRVTLNKQ